MAYIIKNLMATSLSIPPQIRLAPGQEIELPDAIDSQLIVQLVLDNRVSFRERPSQPKVSFAAADSLFVNYTVASAPSVAIPFSQVMLNPTTDCWITIDETVTNAPVAVAGSGLFVAANEKLILQIEPGRKIAAIRATVDGRLNMYAVR